MITKKDKVFLRTIQHLTQTRRGVPPSFREIQAALGLRSINPVFWRISKLRNAEMIEAVPRRARTIHLTKSGIRLLKDEDDMPTMELTESERLVILERRRAQKKAEEDREKRPHLLETAFKYEKWLQENQAGSTFSTFCDEFGYDGPKRDVIFGQVRELRELAIKMVGE